MKKFIFLLPLAAIMSFFSCIGDGNENEPDYIEIGTFLYEVAFDQNTYGLDPIYNSLKLNVLLSEAKSQDISLTDLEALQKMKFKIKGKDITVMELLFPSQMSLSIEEDGVYILEFNALQPWSGIGYDGKMIINTGKKLLDELQTDEGWMISLEGRGKANFFYTNGTYTVTVYDGASFGIFGGQAPGELRLAVSGYNAVYSYMNFESDWSGDYVLSYKKDSEGPLDIENSHKTVFEFYGAGAGKIFHGGEMEYNISSDTPLKIICSCDDTYKTYLIESGKATAKFTGEYNKEFYPVPDASMEWQKGPDNCTHRRTLHYNGVYKTYNYGFEE